MKKIQMVGGLILGALLFARPCHAGDQFAFAFMDPAALQDTIVVMADNYDEAVDAYAEAQKMTREAVEKRFTIEDTWVVNAKSEED